MTLSQVKKEEQPNMESLTWGDLTWVDIKQPTKREIEYLAQNYSFHQMALDDCLSKIQRPKIDEHEGYTFIVLLLPVWHKEIRVTTASQISIFVSKNYLVTLRTGEFKPLNELFEACKNNESVCQENFNRGSVYLLYRAIDVLIDYGFRVMDKILSWVEDVEDLAFDEKAESAKELAVLRRDIIAQRRIFWLLRTVVSELEGKLQRFTTMDMGVYFGDLADHVNKIWDVLDECKEVTDVFKDTDFILSQDRLNRVMRVLTVISTIVLPFMIISSLFGMNIPLPGASVPGHPLSLPLLLVAMMLMTGTMLYLFRRKRWL